jgi:hypothetical protein
MEARPAKELHDMIVEAMGNPEGFSLTIAPDPASGWHVTVYASGDLNRTTKYNQIALQIADELRQKYSLKA